MQKYLAFYQPDVVLLRSIPLNDIGYNKRSQKLIEQIKKVALKQNLEVFEYSRQQIREIFEKHESYSKFEISKRLAEWFPQLEIYTYPKRKYWMSENHNAGVFDALSLGVVHYHQIFNGFNNHIK